MNKQLTYDAGNNAIVEEQLECVKETFDRAKGITDINERKRILLRCVRCIREIPKTTEFISAYQYCLDLTNGLEPPADRKSILIVIAKELPGTIEFAPLYMDVLKNAVTASNTIDDPRMRKDALLDVIDELPEKPDFHGLYMQAMAYAIKAADEIRDSQYRIHALLSLSKMIPGTPEFNPLRLKAFKLALNLAANVSRPNYEKHLLASIAKTLPKSCDYSFYRQYTLLGIAKEIPKTGEFLNLYKDAIKLAIAAATTIDEPYYRKYALSYIAEDLLNTPELYDLYKETVMEAFKAANNVVEPVVRIHALIDVLKLFPKTADFFPQLQQTLKDILEFYSVKRRISDISAIEVIDFILVAEEKGIRDEKKKRFTKTKYAHILAKELEQFGLQLNDIRLIEILKPYTHVWIQPKELRNSVTRIVEHLESLKTRFHGKEIERPVFVNEYFPAYSGKRLKTGVTQTIAKDCISIDLGATNTVIMRRRWGSQPEFITLNSVSRQYNEVSIVPTILSIKSDSIGTMATDDEAITNFKRTLLENRQETKKYMEQYLTILYRHLKETVQPQQRWTSIFSNNIADKIYITIPVGFPSYKKSVGEIIEKTIKGVDVELLEEPLAAAIGYQMADETDKIVMVIDFGGSTLDTMIVRLNINEVYVIAKPDRSKMLGGRDIDIWLAEFLAKKIGWAGEKPPLDLINKAEEIKIALSDRTEAVFKWNETEICKVSRKDFEEVLDNHEFYKAVDRSISYVLWRAEKVGIKKERLEAVLLTGGSSLIPSFKEKIASLFPALHNRNSIYNHSPFSAVAMGAALYATRSISDKHLGLAYAIRYKTGDEDIPFAYDIIFEKGEAYPLEKTFKLHPSKSLGEQKEIFIELFEVPERYIVRRWEKEGGIEFIKQVMKSADNIVLKDLSIITLYFEEPIEEDVHVTFCVSDSGQIKIKYGKDNKEIETGIRLQ